MGKIWLTWNEINSQTENRTLLLYGRSEDWVHKTLQKLKKKPKYIIDRDKSYHNKTFFEIPIIPIESLDCKKNNFYFVITAGEYEGIISILIEKGYKPGEDFCCCPEYRDYKILDQIREHPSQVLIASSDYNDQSRARSSRNGGGLYLYDTNDQLCEKIIKGSFRQFIKIKDNYFIVDYVDQKLLIVDSKLKTLDNWKLDYANYCGLAYCEDKDVFVLVNSGLDTISIHAMNDFKLIDRRTYSEKTNLSNTSQHHLNDVICHKDKIYVSYFSHSGNWKKGIYDGGVSELDMNHLHDQPTPVIANLWKPHSPEIINGSIHILDSMRGKLFGDGPDAIGKFNGFIRGLCYDGTYYYVGQSEDMYISKRFANIDSIMLNAGFYKFDCVTKACRFFPMMGNMNVHDLMIYEEK